MFVYQKVTHVFLLSLVFLLDSQPLSTSFNQFPEAHHNAWPGDLEPEHGSLCPGGVGPEGARAPHRSSLKEGQDRWSGGPQNSKDMQRHRFS